MSSTNYDELLKRLDYPLHDNWAGDTMKEAADVIVEQDAKIQELERVAGDRLNDATEQRELVKQLQAEIERLKEYEIREAYRRSR